MSDSKNTPVYTGLLGWIDRRLPIVTLLHKEYQAFPVPRNLNYWWSFGAIATVVLVMMILSGIALAMQYTPQVDLAFNSVERIMRDVNYGWLIRYIHMNGASMFFIAVYIHMFRGMYYGSHKNPRELLWILGIVIFLLMMATAFMGYVLPWGQMSYWGATVITNLFSAIPVIGKSIVTWLWGGFSVGNPTLNRFFALHYLLPFVILGVLILHIAAMHVAGSNNPDGIEPKGPQDMIMFSPHVITKDSIAIVLFLIFWAYFVFFAPNYMGHPDNYLKANSLATPSEIVPEWYFLPYYAMLRSWTYSLGFITAKLGGVILMFGGVILLAFIPWLDRSPIRSCRYRPIYRVFLILFVINAMVLGFSGGKPAGDPFYTPLAKLCTFWYFFHLLVITPVVSRFEPRPKLPNSISDAIFKRKNPEAQLIKEEARS